MRRPLLPCINPVRTRRETHLPNRRVCLVHRRLRHALEFRARQCRVHDGEGLDFAGPGARELCDSEAEGGEAGGDVGPGGGEDVGLRPGAGEQGLGGGVVREGDGKGERGAVEGGEEGPGDVCGAGKGSDDDVVVGGGVFLAGAFDEGEDGVGVGHSGVDDGGQDGEAGEGAALEVLGGEADAARFGEVGDALGEADLVVAVVVGDEFGHV